MTPGIGESGAVRWTRSDTFLVAAVGLAAFLFAQWYMQVYRAAGGEPFFYQQEFGPAVLLACGKGFSNPELPTVPALQTFLDEQVDRFRCEELPASIRLVPPTAFQSFSRYLMTAVALVWRVTRVRWGAVDLLTAGFFGIAIAAAYAALRFVCGPTLSMLVTLLWAISPWHLQNLPHLRDYSKVPFFVVTLVATAVLFSERRASRLVALGMVFGLVQGFGYGMRVDVGLNFIPFLIVLFAGVPDLRRNYRVRLACATAAIAMFMLAAYPILVTYNESGSLWHVMLLGLATAFDINLNLAVPRPPYDFGYMYHDLYLETVVRSYWGRLHPDSGLFRLASHTYGTACREYYEALASVFPGDILTRMVASAVNVVNFPFLPGYGHVPLGILNRTAVMLYELRGSVMDMLEGSGPLAVTAVLVLTGMERLRYACIAFLLLCGWAAYPSLQYQFRHMFHLEFLVLAAIAAGGSLTWQRMSRFRYQRGQESARESMTRALKSTTTVGALFLTAGLTLVVARAIQVPKAQGLLTGYLSAPVDPVAATSDALPDGRIRLEASVFGSPPDDGVQTALLVAEIVPDRCGPSSSMAATFRYELPDPDPGFTFDFSRQTKVPLIHGAGFATRVFLPVYAIYQGKTLISRFTGVEVPASYVSCVQLYRVRNLAPLPLLLPATLTPGWKHDKLYQQLRLDAAVPPAVRHFFIRWWPSVRKRLATWVQHERYHHSGDQA
jgi:hypothetical protein